MKSPLLVSLLAALVAVADTSDTYIPGFLQSGPDLAGSTFPASALYNAKTNAVVIVGSTYGRYFDGFSNAITQVPRATSTCFVASVSLPSGNDSGASSTSTMQFESRATLGEGQDATEACSSMVFSSHGSKLILAGHSELGGFMDDLYDASLLTPAQQYGMLVDMELVNSANTVVGGRVLQESRITYPVAVTSSLDDFVYVVSQETDSIKRNDVGTVDATTSNTVFEAVSDQVDPMRFFEYGDNYQMSVGRYKTFNAGPTKNGELQETLTEGWTQRIATSDNVAVHVAGMLQLKSSVVVVGSTKGVGPEFGTGDNEPPVLEPGTMSGFVTKLDAASGHHVGSHRVQSINGKDDWIGGACANSATDPDHFYVVGATQGEMQKAGAWPSDDVSAYVKKINLETLTEVWTYQLSALRDSSVEADTEVRGVSCAVSPDGTALWFGGVALDGAVLADSGTTESFGGDDVFVTKLSAETGLHEFTRQIGSTEDDGMAMRGGLVVDGDGNAVVVGHTWGSFYRERSQAEEDGEWIADVFVATIEGTNGKIAFPVAHPEYTAPSASGSANGSGGGEGSSGYGAPGMDGEGKDVVLPPSAISNEDDSKNHGAVMVAVYLVVLCVGPLLIALLLFAKRARSNYADISTDRSKVIKFLNEFDVDDIDLKHSATGGWHCSYSNDLANGVNRRAERGPPFGSPGGGSTARSAVFSASSLSKLDGGDPLLTAPMTNSSVLQDSLFMDDDDAELGANGGGAGLGGGKNGRSIADRFSGSRSSQRQGYDGLIDAYNATWDDRRGGSDNMQLMQEDDQPPAAWGKEIL